MGKFTRDYFFTEEMYRGYCPGDVRMPIQEYNSLRAAVMICATLVNTQTHTQTAFDRYRLSQLS